MSITETKVKRTVTTETKIKRALTRLQKLVHQYYDENPDITDSREYATDVVTYYGSAVFGIVQDEEHVNTNIANITVRGKNGHYFEIASPINRKPVK